MSSNDRARHLEQFVEHSEPPPLAQHLPQMPSASQRFTAVQQQQLNAQKQGDFLNYLDPYRKSGAQKLSFDPFEMLVKQQQQQDDESTSEDDDDTTETTDDTVSTSAESIVQPAPQVVKPKPVAQPTATRATRPRAPPPPPPPKVEPPVAAPVVTVPPPQPAAPAASPPVAAQAPVVEDEPRGIMDQSMAFLKRNFWAILTVIVVLIALGVAFIYFARPRPGETTVPKTTPQVKATGPPGTPPRWSNVENEVIAPAEEITALQKEKSEIEEAYQALQKRIQKAEQDAKVAGDEQKTHLRDIESLQKICDQLTTEKDELKEQNAQLADFIVQNQLLPEEKPAQKTPAPDPEFETETVIPEAESVAKQTDFDEEKIDVEAIEKSAVFETVDNTQPTETPTAEEEEKGEEPLEEEKLPWQK